MKESKYKVGDILRERGRRTFTISPENFLVITITFRHDEPQIKLQPRYLDEYDGKSFVLSESAVDKLYYKTK